MNRRQALKRVAILTGGTLSTSTVAAILSGCNAVTGSKKWTPKLVTPEQNDLLTTIAECIIPQTDTPGAKTARVNEFIDLMLADWFSEKEKQHFLAGLADMDARAQNAYSKIFTRCTFEEQAVILTALEQESVKFIRENSQSPGEEPLLPFFGKMKELTLVGYYTSEIGMTQELKYIPAAGAYKSCVPFDEIGRAWVS
ncbi:MAG: gluconate 2-dehydrogenase subunit 3 family protein [bacterium]